MSDTLSCISHRPLLQTRSKVKVTDLKCAKMVNFVGCLLCWYACNQKTTGELLCYKTISKFCLYRFFYSFSFGVTWLQTQGVPPLANEVCLLWGVDQ